MTNIIRTRLERMLLLGWPTTAHRRRQSPEKLRRGAHHKNGKTYTPVCLSLRPDQLERLDKICETFKVARGVIVRDALELWLGIAEEEQATAKGLIEPPQRKRKVE